MHGSMIVKSNLDGVTRYKWRTYIRILETYDEKEETGLK